VITIYQRYRGTDGRRTDDSVILWQYCALRRAVKT